MQYENETGKTAEQLLLDKLGAPWHRRKEHPKAEQILQLRAQGYSIRQIAKAFDVHRTTIHRRLREVRLREEDQQRKDRELQQRVRREFDERMKDMEKLDQDAGAAEKPRPRRLRY